MKIGKFHLLGKSFVLLLVSLGMGAACVSLDPGKQKGKLIENGQSAKYSYKEIIELEQGWTEATQQSFYFETQGSKILPYSWFLALEQENNQEDFRSPENMDRLRYLPVKPSQKNLDGLPIGWGKTTEIKGQETKEWVGMTCAACHTTQINYTDPETETTFRMRIDGGPALADFEQMNIDLVASLKATVKTETKFDRFAQKVLGEGSTSARATLEKDLNEQISILQRRNDINHSRIKYGYSRLDAIGAIFNQTASAFIDMPGNQRDSDAPVSYPFLWGTSQSDVVQWTGFAPNNIPQLPSLLSGLGPLIRNGGEVLGVYGTIDIPELNAKSKVLEDLAGLIKGKDTKKILKFLAEVEGSSDLIYASSLSIKNLGRLEKWVEDLRSPQWPSPVFPEIDQAMAERGKSGYLEHCGGCHTVILRANEGEPYRAILTPLEDVQTDDQEIVNMLLTRTAGRYEGRKQKVVIGDVIGKDTTGLPTLVNATVGSLLYDLETTLKAANHSQFKGFAPPVPQPIEVYKARPLNGIWATAPFLHNGSVPNLWEMLLPVADRSKTFQVGSREYDPKVVGFITRQTETPDFKPFTLDTKHQGNRNTGHTYGTELNDTAKWEILEYMKTL
jgi:hypothetical protein